jgi:hypothetical protein
MSRGSINTPSSNTKLVWASAILAAVIGAIIVVRLQAAEPSKVQPQRNTANSANQGARRSSPGQVKASAASYSSGEAVTVSITNRSRQPLKLRNSAPWRIVNQADQTVFTPISAQVITEVPAGQTKTWTWDQKDNSGKQVPVGRYRVVFERYGLDSFEIK